MTTDRCAYEAGGTVQYVLCIPCSAVLRFRLRPNNDAGSETEQWILQFVCTANLFLNKRINGDSVTRKVPFFLDY